MENRFGLLEVDWAKGELSMKAIDVDGAVRFTRSIALGELRF